MCRIKRQRGLLVLLPFLEEVASELSVMIPNGGNNWDKRRSAATTMVKPTFSLSTGLTVPVRFTPFGARHRSFVAWNCKNVSSAAISTSTLFSLKIWHMRSASASARLLHSAGTVCEISRKIGLLWVPASSKMGSFVFEKAKNVIYLCSTDYSVRYGRRTAVFESIRYLFKWIPVCLGSIAL